MIMLMINQARGHPQIGPVLAHKPPFTDQLFVNALTAQGVAIIPAPLEGVAQSGPRFYSDGFTTQLTDPVRCLADIFRLSRECLRRKAVPAGPDCRAYPTNDSRILDNRAVLTADSRVTALVSMSTEGSTGLRGRDWATDKNPRPPQQRQRPCRVQTTGEAACTG